MCLFPKLIKNRKYTKTKKNGGIIPPIKDERVKLVPIGCQKCIECRKKKARDWQIRLQEEIKTSKNGKYITLTFNNESIKKLAEENKEYEGYILDNQIATIAVRRFLERWRKKYKKSVKHWLITELGHNGTENIHLHGIIWTDKNGEEVQKLWQYGFIWRGYEQEEKINGWSKKLYVSERTVNYITKYITKQDEKHKGYNSKILTSAGIGSKYKESTNAKKNKYNPEGETNETYRTNTGHKISMPIYYRNGIYNEEEREILWLEKLNKNERWVCGEKVKADNDKEYWELLKWYRTINKRLGYGDDTKNWNEEQYELARRKLLMEKRKGNK